MIEVVVGGNVVSSTQTSFLIRIGSQANNPPVFEPPSPATAGSSRSPGDPPASTSGQRRGAADTVELIAGALPPGAAFNANSGNPPRAGSSHAERRQDGEDFLVNFTAQDNQIPPAADFRSYTIRVRAGAADRARAARTRSAGRLQPVLR